MRAFMVLLACAFVVPDALAAQARDPCSYDLCALRIEHRLRGVRVVQGAEPGARVPASALADIVAGTDAAMAAFAHYRIQRRRSILLGAAGFGVVMATSVASSPGGDIGVDMMGLIAGMSLGIAAGWQEARSRDSLQRVVWWYNRGFAEP